MGKKPFINISTRYNKKNKIEYIIYIWKGRSFHENHLFESQPAEWC